MARRQSVDDEQLIAQLSCVFRDVGYAGASLSLLAAATGLKKASLYHRFPDGKQQMAQEVLSAALDWFAKNILATLKSDAPPAERVAIVAERLNAFYAQGRQACLLNMLISPREETGPFSEAIKSAFEALIDAFATLARDAGHTPAEARRCAQRAVILIQGSLVVSRGLGASEPFQTEIAGLADELLTPATRRTPKESS